MSMVGGEKPRLSIRVFLTWAWVRRQTRGLPSVVALHMPTSTGGGFMGGGLSSGPIGPVGPVGPVGPLPPGPFPPELLLLPVWIWPVQANPTAAAPARTNWI